MQLVINGKKEEFNESTTIANLIKIKSLPDNTFAIALNMVFVPREHYAITELKHLDEIEILIAMQGG